MCWHRWSQWVDRRESGACLIQERRCTKCNKAKRRMVDPDPLYDFDDEESPL